MAAMAEIPAPGAQAGSGRKRPLKKALAALMAAAMMLSTLPRGESALAAPGGIFNSVEKRKDGLKPFPKWQGALEKYFKERDDREGPCDSPGFNRCHHGEWTDFLTSIRDLDVMKQLDRVNDYMNKHRYILDPVNWGVRDYWESPGEFFARFGDCEDYSIAKYLSLRALGFPTEQLRIIILKDLNLGIFHAVLAVYIEDRIYVLDNQLAIVVEDRRIRHYQPLYSVNETGWWRHLSG